MKQIRTSIISFIVILSSYLHATEVDITALMKAAEERHDAVEEMIATQFELQNRYHLEMKALFDEFSDNGRRTKAPEKQIVQPSPLSEPPVYQVLR